MNEPRITLQQAVNYEARASFWMSWVGNSKLQDLVGAYLAWKVRRKYGRYVRSIVLANDVAEYRRLHPEVFKA